VKNIHPLRQPAESRLGHQPSQEQRNQPKKVSTLQPPVASACAANGISRPLLIPSAPPLLPFSLPLPSASALFLVPPSPHPLV
jgi:hypothetical protein